MGRIIYFVEHEGNARAGSILGPKTVFVLAFDYTTHVGLEISDGTIPLLSMPLSFCEAAGAAR